MIWRSDQIEGEVTTALSSVPFLWNRDALPTLANAVQHGKNTYITLQEERRMKITFVLSL
jgi:hypothetical protein